MEIKVVLPEDDTEAGQLLQQLQVAALALAQLEGSPAGSRALPPSGFLQLSSPQELAQELAWDSAPSASSSDSELESDSESESEAETELQGRVASSSSEYAFVYQPARQLPGSPGRSSRSSAEAEDPGTTGSEAAQRTSLAAQVMAEHERRFPLHLEAAGASVPLTGSQQQRLQGLPQPVSRASLLQALDWPDLAEPEAGPQHEPERASPMHEQSCVHSQPREQEPAQASSLPEAAQQQYRPSRAAVEVGSGPSDKGLRRFPGSRSSVSLLGR